MNGFVEPLDADTRKRTILQLDQPKYSGQYLIAFLLFLGTVNANLIRSNLNIAVVEMTSNKTVIVNNQTTTRQPDFNWDSKIKGVVTSSFFYGYLLCPVAGYISGKWGGAKSFGIASSFMAILTILTPTILKFNFYWFIFCRVLTGMSEAVCYTSISDIWSKWAAPEDRSKFISTTFAGFYMGTISALFLCGYIGHEFGWPAIFYITGSSTLIWCIVWGTLASNEPLDKSSLRRTPSEEIRYPWKPMILSKSVIVLCMLKFTIGWGDSLLASALPLFIEDILHVNTSQTGFLSALPSIISTISIPIIGITIDIHINRKWLTVTNTHKLFAVTGFLGTSIAMLLITFSTNFITIMIYLSSFKIFLSFIMVVDSVLPLYIATKFASNVAGITNLWYTMGNIIIPMFVGFAVTNSEFAQWRIIFSSTGGLMITVAFVVLFFLSSELQSWALPSKQTEARSNLQSDV